VGFFLLWLSGVFTGFFAKNGVQCVVLLWWICGGVGGTRGELTAAFLRCAEWDRFVKFIFGRTQKNDNLPLDLGSA
jgi:hypothetical protein